MGKKYKQMLAKTTLQREEKTSAEFRSLTQLFSAQPLLPLTWRMLTKVKIFFDISHNNEHYRDKLVQQYKTSKTMNMQKNKPIHGLSSVNDISYLL
jgi:hypothetical protein